MLDFHGLPRYYERVTDLLKPGNTPDAKAPSQNPSSSPQPGGGGAAPEVNLSTQVDEAFGLDPITVTVSTDDIEAYISIKKDPDLMKDLSKDDVLDKLKEARVAHGIDQTVLEEVVKLAREGQEVNNRLIAKGELPEDGKDALVNMEMDFDPVAGIVNDESGKIDFRERNLVKSVGQGFVIATKTMPTAGKDGRSVTGSVLKARKGQDKKFTAGKNIEVLEENGVFKYVSLVNGRPVNLGNLIEVQPAVQIKGDLDYSVGNIRAKGPVIIEGRVAAGFTIEAEGDVEVGDFVEASTIKAKGSIILKGGIKGAGKGYIYSEANVIAKYIERSKVEAKGDVLVANDILDSHVLCGGSVKVVTGKGSIMGGFISATKGVVAKRIGSGQMTSVTTVIEAGIDYFVERGIAELERVIEQLQVKVDAVEARFAKDLLSQGDAAVSKFTGYQQRLFLKAAKTWKDLLAEKQKHIDKRVALMGNRDTVISATVDVLEEIEPRVELRLGHAKLVTDDALRQVKFVEDPKKHVIISRFRGTVTA
ncbi:MAG: DUF342 domain-containing protein [Nitrospirae bacterium]|nr:DUF342 domain-containing protein [Nitrospirota bacterium]